MIVIIVIVLIILCIAWLIFLNKRQSNNIKKYQANFEIPDNKITIDILYDGVIGKKYYYYNPSIFRDTNGKVKLLTRIGQAWCKSDENDSKSIEKNFNTSVGSENFINIDELELPSCKKIFQKIIRPISRICGDIYGCEDPRGFSYRDNNYALCMEYRKIKNKCVPGVVVLNLDDEKILSLNHPINTDEPQKNWLPLIIRDKLYIVTDTNPHRVIEPNLSTGECIIVAETQNPFTNNELRGSAGYIHVNNCFIGIVHYKYDENAYSHLLYAFQDEYPFNIVAMSDKFCIKVGNKSCIHKTQMLTGILLSNDIVYISGGHQDRNCFVAKIPLLEVLNLLDFKNRLKPIAKYIPRISNQALPSQKIPFKIVSILILDDEILPPFPTYLRDCLDSWNALSPEYDIQILDKHDCVKFIKDNFEPDVLHAYNSLKPYAYKCDLARICWLYIHGGIYKDIRQTLLVPLSKIINPENDIIFPKDLIMKGQINYAILNSFIGCVPRHPIMKKYIDMMVKNIKERKYGTSSLDITGPNVFGYAAREILGGQGEWIPKDYGTHQILEHLGKIICKNKIPIIRTKPDKAEFTTDFKSGNIYGKMWNARNVYKNI